MRNSAQSADKEEKKAMAILPKRNTLKRKCRLKVQRYKSQKEFQMAKTILQNRKVYNEMIARDYILCSCSRKIIICFFFSQVLALDRSQAISHHISCESMQQISEHDIFNCLFYALYFGILSLWSYRSLCEFVVLTGYLTGGFTLKRFRCTFRLTFELLAFFILAEHYIFSISMVHFWNRDHIKLHSAFFYFHSNNIAVCNMH